MDQDDPFDTYVVVMNDEEQYSIWPEAKPVPEGWKIAGPAGDKESCLAWVDENWTDMRPRSLREYMEGLKSPS